MKRIIKITASVILTAVIAFSATTMAANAQEDMLSFEELLKQADIMREYYLYIYGDSIVMPPTEEPTINCTDEPTEPPSKDVTTLPEATTEPATEPAETTESCSTAENPTTEPVESTDYVTTEPCSTAPPSTSGDEISEIYITLEDAVKNANYILDNDFNEQEKIEAYYKLKTAVETAAKFYVAGDITLDGKLNVKDVTTVQKFAAQIITFISDLAYKQGDINCDGKLNIKDATVMQRKIAQLA